MTNKQNYFTYIDNTSDDNDKTMKNLYKQINVDGVDASKCEWRTGVEHCGYYECMLNKSCDYNCDWYKRRKLEQQLKCSEAQCEGMFVTHTDLEMKYKAKEQECERLKWYLNEIRDEELSHLDIEWDEYETSARQEDYSNIITLVERALGEIDD